MLKSLSVVKNLIPILLLQNYRNFEFSIVLLPRQLYFVLKFLKLNIGYQYNLLTCISGVDLLSAHYRFMVSYELLSLVFNSRLRIKIFLGEYTLIPSAVAIFINANWWEREIWDLYGLFFKNHPDLRRILTDYGFEGYPLRKDFPLYGYKEMHYDRNQKIVTYSFIQFSQEYRSFNYNMPW